MIYDENSPEVLSGFGGLSNRLAQRARAAQALAQEKARIDAEDKMARQFIAEEQHRNRMIEQQRKQAADQQQASYEEAVVRQSLRMGPAEQEAVAATYPETFARVLYDNQNGGQVQPAVQSGPTADWQAPLQLPQGQGAVQPNYVTQRDGSQVNVNYNINNQGNPQVPLNSYGYRDPRTGQIIRVPQPHNADIYGGQRWEETNKYDFNHTREWMFNQTGRVNPDGLPPEQADEYKRRADEHQKRSLQLATEIANQKEGGNVGSKGDDSAIFDRHAILPGLWKLKYGFDPEDVRKINVYTRREESVKMLSDYYDNQPPAYQAEIGNKESWIKKALRHYGMDEASDDHGEAFSATKNFVSSVARGAADMVGGVAGVAEWLFGDGDMDTGPGSFAKGVAEFKKRATELTSNPALRAKMSYVQDKLQQEDWLGAATAILGDAQLTAEFVGQIGGAVTPAGLAGKLAAKLGMRGVARAAATGVVDAAGATGSLYNEIAINKAVPEGSDAARLIAEYGLTNLLVSLLPGQMEQMIQRGVIGSKRAGLKTAAELNNDINTIIDAAKQYGGRVTRTGDVATVNASAAERFVRSPLDKVSRYGTEPVTEYIQARQSSEIEQAIQKDGSVDYSKVDEGIAHAQGMFGAALGAGVSTPTAFLHGNTRAQARDHYQGELNKAIEHFNTNDPVEVAKRQFQAWMDEKEGTQIEKYQYAIEQRQKANGTWINPNIQPVPTTRDMQLSDNANFYDSVEQLKFQQDQALDWDGETLNVPDNIFRGTNDPDRVQKAWDRVSKAIITRAGRDTNKAVKAQGELTATLDRNDPRYASMTDEEFNAAEIANANAWNALTDQAELANTVNNSVLSVKDLATAQVLVEEDWVKDLLGKTHAEDLAIIRNATDAHSSQISQTTAVDGLTNFLDSDRQQVASTLNTLADGNVQIDVNDLVSSATAVEAYLTQSDPHQLSATRAKLNHLGMLKTVMSKVQGGKPESLSQVEARAKKYTPPASKSGWTGAEAARDHNRVRVEKALKSSKVHNDATGSEVSTYSKTTQDIINNAMGELFEVNPEAALDIIISAVENEVNAYTPEYSIGGILRDSSAQRIESDNLMLAELRAIRNDVSNRGFSSPKNIKAKHRGTQLGADKLFSRLPTDEAYRVAENVSFVNYLLGKEGKNTTRNDTMDLIAWADRIEQQLDSGELLSVPAGGGVTNYLHAAARNNSGNKAIQDIRTMVRYIRGMAEQSRTNQVNRSFGDPELDFTQIGGDIGIHAKAFYETGKLNGKDFVEAYNNALSQVHQAQQQQQAAKLQQQQAASPVQQRLATNPPTPPAPKNTFKAETRAYDTTSNHRTAFDNNTSARKALSDVAAVAKADYEARLKRKEDGKNKFLAEKARKARREARVAERRNNLLAANRYAPTPTARTETMDKQMGYRAKAEELRQAKERDKAAQELIDREILRREAEDAEREAVLTEIAEKKAFQQDGENAINRDIAVKRRMAEERIQAVFGDGGPFEKALAAEYEPVFDEAVRVEDERIANTPIYDPSDIDNMPPQQQQRVLRGFYEELNKHNSDVVTFPGDVSPTPTYEAVSGVIRYVRSIITPEKSGDMDVVKQTLRKIVDLAMTKFADDYNGVTPTDRQKANHTLRAVTRAVERTATTDKLFNNEDVATAGRFRNATNPEKSQSQIPKSTQTIFSKTLRNEWFTGELERFGDNLSVGHLAYGENSVIQNELNRLDRKGTLTPKERGLHRLLTYALNNPQVHEVGIKLMTQKEFDAEFPDHAGDYGHISYNVDKLTNRATHPTIFVVKDRGDTMGVLAHELAHAAALYLGHDMATSNKGVFTVKYGNKVQPLAKVINDMVGKDRSRWKSVYKLLDGIFIYDNGTVKLANEAAAVNEIVARVIAPYDDAKSNAALEVAIPPALRDAIIEAFFDGDKDQMDVLRMVKAGEMTKGGTWVTATAAAGALQGSRFKRSVRSGANAGVNQKPTKTVFTFGVSDDNPAVESEAQGWYNETTGSYTFRYRTHGGGLVVKDGLNYDQMVSEAQGLGLWIDNVQNRHIIDRGQEFVRNRLQEFSPGMYRVLTKINQLLGGDEDHLVAPVRMLAGFSQWYATNQMYSDSWMGWVENAIANTVGTAEAAKVRGKLETATNRIRTEANHQIFGYGVNGNKTMYDLKRELLDMLTKIGWDEDKVNNTLYAMRAADYDAHVRNKFPNDPRWNGLARDPNSNISGFSWGGKADPRGERWMNNLSPQDKKIADDLKRLVTKLNDHVLTYEYNAGRISEQQYNESINKFYVPLKNETDHATAFQRGPTGRRSKADKPLNHLLANHIARIKAAERSQQMQVLQDLMAEYPVTGFITFNSQSLNKTHDGSYALQADAFVNGDSITFFRDGQRVTATVVHPTVKQMLKRRKDQADKDSLMGQYIDYASSMTQWLGLVRTATPFFAKTAFLRDMGMAFFNNQAAFKGRSGLTAVEHATLGVKTMRDMVRYAPMIMKARANMDNADWRYKVYRSEGGIGKMEQFDLNHVRQELDADVFNRNSLKSRGKRAAGKYLDILHFSDDAARFSVWMNYLETKHGRPFDSEQQMAKFLQDNPDIADTARDASKNITGNFEQKGGDRLTRSHFMFWSAIQAGLRTTYGMMNPAYGKQGMASVLGLMAFVAAGILSDDEEDEDGRLVSSRVKNLGNQIQLGGVNFNLAQELRPAVGIAEGLAYMIRGDWDGGRALSHIIDTGIQGVGVISPAHTDNALFNVMYGFTPTMLQPVLLNATEQNFFGGSIRPNVYDDEGKLDPYAPDYVRFNDNNSDTAIWMAQQVHKYLGVDTLPGTYDNAFAHLMGGFITNGRKIARDVEAGTNLLEAVSNQLLHEHKVEYNTFAIKNEVDKRIETALKRMRTPEDDSVVNPGQSTWSKEVEELINLRTELKKEYEEAGKENGGSWSELSTRLREARSAGVDGTELIELRHRLEQSKNAQTEVYMRYSRILDEMGY